MRSQNLAWAQNQRRRLSSRRTWTNRSKWWRRNTNSSKICKEPTYSWNQSLSSLMKSQLITLLELTTSSLLMTRMITRSSLSWPRETSLMTIIFRRWISYLSAPLNTSTGSSREAALITEVAPLIGSETVATLMVGNSTHPITNLIIVWFQNITITPTCPLIPVLTLIIKETVSTLWCSNIQEKDSLSTTIMLTIKSNFVYHPSNWVVQKALSAHKFTM